MFRELKNIVYDKTFKVIILENKINIINYTEVVIFEDERIVIKAESKLINIKGKNLIINRLEENEILVLGKIKSVEFG